MYPYIYAPNRLQVIKKVPLVFFLICLAFTLVLYFPSGLYFLNDDLIHIPLSSQGILFQRHSLRPVHDLLLSMEVTLWDKDPFGYHLVALMIHLSCGGALFYFTHSLLLRYRVVDAANAINASFISSGLFLIYAFHAEGVLWIIGEGAALSTLFYLLSIVCYLHAEKSFWLFPASLVFFFAGLFTYEAVWVAPLAILCIFFLDHRLLKKEWKTVFPRLLLYIGSFVIYLLVRVRITGQLTGTYEYGETGLRFQDLLLNYNRLLARSFLPPVASTPVFVSLYGVILILFIAAFLRYQKNAVSRMFAWVLLFLFLASYLPYIFLGIDTHSRESERFLYLPSALLSLFAGFIITTISFSKKQLILACSIVCVYNIFFLYTSRRDYNVASQLSKEVYEAAGKASGQHYPVTIVHLPSQLNGVPVFRAGFKDGLRWLYGSDTTRIVVTDTVLLQGTPLYFRHLFIQDFPAVVQNTTTDSGIILNVQPDKRYFLNAE